MVLIKELRFFHHFLFVRIVQEKVFDYILERNKVFLDDYKNKVIKISKNWDFVKGVSPSFWSKN